MAATVLAAFCLSELFSLSISSLGLNDLFLDTPSLGTVYDIALSSIAFAVGGAITRARFSVFALFLAVILQYWALLIGAERNGTSVPYELMRQWPHTIVFFSSAMTGWFVGSVISAKLQNRLAKNAT